MKDVYLESKKSVEAEFTSLISRAIELSNLMVKVKGDYGKFNETEQKAAEIHHSNIALKLTSVAALFSK